MVEPFPQIHPLSAGEIDEVIWDTELMNQGSVIYFSVDPYEVVDFCFPFNPADLKHPDVAKIADNQIALYSVFYERSQKPVLLDEYILELQQHNQFLIHATNSAYRKTDQLERLILDSGLDQIIPTGKVISDDHLLEIIAETFNILGAVVLGVYKKGVERFSEICTTRLLTRDFRSDSCTEQENEFILEAFRNSRPTRLSQQIYSKLATRIETIVKKQPWMRRREYTMLKASKRDADAVDRLIALNTTLERAFKAGKLERRHIFLYLSSASKTKAIFELSATRKAFPRIDGKNYSIWRTRDQVFASVVHRGTTHAESIINLKRVREVIERIGIYRQNYSETGGIGCDSCVLVGPEGDEPCALRELCIQVRDVSQIIEQQREEANNYALVSSLRDYQDLIDLEGANKEHQKYTDLFNQLLDNRNITNYAKDRKELYLLLVQVNSEFANSLLENLLRIDEVAVAVDAYMRRGRDPVASILQHLPTLPIVPDPDYAEIIGDVVEFYKTPQQGESDRINQKINLVRSACERFLRIGTRNSGFSPAHELVRCYLYLALPTRLGDEHAYGHASALLNTVGVSQGLDKLEPEYRYLMCWAARRARNYAAGDKLATDSIDLYPEDPRFYQARCLNTFSWFADDSRPLPVPDMLTMKQAIADAETAISCSKTKDDVRYQDIILACYNNLACFWSYRLDSTFDISESRENLNNLKALFKREFWDPQYPEFYHTEAYVEYMEYKHPPRDKTDDVSYLRFKLQNAREMIEKAYSLHQKPDYEKLRKKIVSALEDLMG